MIHKQMTVKKIIANPSFLNRLDFTVYSKELEKSGLPNLIKLVENIIDELKNPFKDPRKYRTANNLEISNEKLFYLLIDESPRTFKKGIIVTATVSKVLDNFVLCKLDNSLDASIQKGELEKANENLFTIINPGHVVTGRIHEIKFQEEAKFGVALNCKTKDLRTHEEYVDKSTVHKDDMVNHAF
jgi:transcriptional accessory protein Tex/SPT6